LQIYASKKGTKGKIIIIQSCFLSVLLCLQTLSPGEQTLIFYVCDDDDWKYGFNVYILASIDVFIW
jgi:hypothetical protein